MTDTRDELLKAGVRLYAQLRSKHLQALTAGRVAATAGFHRQTFYRHWGTQAEYVNDLLRFALGGENDPVVEGLPAAGDSAAVPSDFESFVRALTRHEFARFTRDHMREFRFGLMTQRGGSSAIDDLLDEFMGRVQREATVGFDALLRAWGREPVPPYTTQAISLAVQSLAMGLSVAEPYVPVPPAAELFEELTVDLLKTMTRPRAT